MTLNRGLGPVNLSWGLEECKFKLGVEAVNLRSGGCEFKLRRPVNLNSGLGPVNLNWGLGVVSFDWGPGPVNLSWSLGVVNLNWGLVLWGLGL